MTRHTPAADSARESSRGDDGRFGRQRRAEASLVDLENVYDEIGAAKVAARRASSVYQMGLKSEVAAISGIAFDDLRFMPHAQWSQIREQYCGSSDRLLPQYTDQA